MNTCRLALAVTAALFCAAAAPAQDLSAYRTFVFGADLAAVAKQVGVQPSDATIEHQRPSLIQVLTWEPRYSLSPARLQLASVKEITFRFHDGKLFRVAVSYERESTEGLTVDDMIEAVSVNYGPASKTADEITFPSYYAESVKVLARWENSEYSFSLVRSSYPLTFGLVGFSKRLDALSTAAAQLGKTIDAQEAPQKELARRQREEAEARAALEKVRLANKIVFRP